MTQPALLRDSLEHAFPGRKDVQDWLVTNATTVLDVTAGTAEASKALVLNASKGISTITSATITTLTSTTVDATTVDAATLEIANVAVTATAAEINRAADMSARIVDCTASSLAVTEADHDGKVITLNRAAGIAVTLPTPAAGMRFEFIVQTTFTGAASIKSAAGTHLMIGHALMGNDSDNTVVLWQALAASTYDTIDLFGTANSTGGIAGQRIVITGLSTTRWHVEITGDAAGTEATPFQDTVA